MHDLIKIYRGGGVKRWHNNITIKEQTNADHSWGVAALIYLYHPNPKHELIKAAIFHDVGEVHTGDMPGNFKCRHPEIAKLLAEAEDEYMKELGLEFDLNDKDKAWLKACDLIDAAMFCIRENQLGNRPIIGTLSELQGLLNMQKNLPKELIPLNNRIQRYKRSHF